jgi:hypothetical protein
MLCVHASANDDPECGRLLTLTNDKTIKPVCKVLHSD